MHPMFGSFLERPSGKVHFRKTHPTQHRSFCVKKLLTESIRQRLVRNICARTGQTYVFYVFYTCPGAGTSPIRLVPKDRAVLSHVCIRNFDVAFYGHQIHSGGSLASRSRTPKTKNQTTIVEFQCPKHAFVANRLWSSRPPKCCLLVIAVNRMVNE